MNSFSGPIVALINGAAYVCARKVPAVATVPALGEVAQTMAWVAALYTTKGTLGRYYDEWGDPARPAHADAPIRR